jgi:hypothetical protein
VWVGWGFYAWLSGKIGWVERKDCGSRDVGSAFCFWYECTLFPVSLFSYSLPNTAARKHFVRSNRSVLQHWPKGNGIE